MIDWMNKQTSNVKFERGSKITVLKTKGAHHCLLDQLFPKHLLKIYYTLSALLNIGSAIVNKHSGTCIVCSSGETEEEQVDK